MSNRSRHVGFRPNGRFYQRDQKAASLQIEYSFGARYPAIRASRWWPGANGGTNPSPSRRQRLWGEGRRASPRVLIYTNSIGIILVSRISRGKILPGGLV